MTFFHSFSLIAEATLWMRLYPVCNRSLPLGNKRFGGSAVPSNPRWLRPPEPPSAPIVSPLALWSLNGIGSTSLILVMKVDYTRSQGMTRTDIFHYNCLFWCVIIIVTVTLYWFRSHASTLPCHPAPLLHQWYPILNRLN